MGSDSQLHVAEYDRMKSAIFVPLFAPMGQGKSTEQAAGTGEGHEGFRVVKPARAPAPAPVPKYTAFSIPREALNAPPAAGSGLEDHDDVAPALPLVKPLIEGSAHAWILRPPGDTSKLDALDPAAVLAVQRELQMHLRRAHLLVDHSTVVVTQQMHDVEQQCAHTVLAFTRLVTASSGEMELLSHTADDLVAATRRAHAKISDMVQLTLRVRGLLSPEQQKQLDGGSALYRSARDSTAPDLVAATDSPTHGRTRSGSAMVALKQLHGSAASRKLSTQGADEARTADSQVELWLEELLPRWDTALDRKRCFAAARKGAGIPPSIRGAIWKRAIGNRLGVTVTQFEGLCVPVEGEDERSNSLDLIGHDVPRTFHRLKLFVNPSESFATDLLVVLQAFARLNFDLGYVQGMSYLAGMLLLNMCASDAWVALNNLIVDNHLFMSLYRMNVPGIVQHARIYVSLFAVVLCVFFSLMWLVAGDDTFRVAA